AGACARMQESDLPGEARTRYGVDQLRAPFLRRGQVRRDVRRVEADVMQPLAVAREKSPDAALRIQWLEQLDFAIPGREQRGAHALVRQLGFLDERKPEDVAVEPISVRQPRDRNAHVMDRPDHKRLLLTEHGGRAASAGVANSNAMV